ncbi:ATP-binding cassette domain-containing protein [Alloscardovia criceti]|uniref:ATP-binding cassette domain-containing protein n=1 Tax=Alloscardovia criceti TaxID=356828 RepID=UPI00036B73E9|nr:ABC transporter ATP-binding protein [Alloscardovia criceti]
MIEFSHVSKEFEGKNVVQDLSFTIQDGEFFVIVGPSGSGKTTLLKMMNGLEKPTQGSITVNGKDVAQCNLRELRLGLGYVFQTGSLFPHLTVAENIGVIASMKKWDAEKIKQETHKLLDQVGLDHTVYADRMPSELSGGQAQRVGIVRALLTKPEVVIMDEPFSALDPMSRTQLQDLVKQLHDAFHTTFIFVTHNMHEAVRLADRLCVLHEGSIEQLGTVEDVTNHPATDFVKNLFENQENQ